MTQDVEGSSPSRCAKLYILVRGDLAPGPQLAQTAHAALQFAREHREAFEARYDVSNVVAVLQVKDEASLRAHADAPGGFIALVIEPDLGDQATALATLEDGRRFSRLPLAGRIATNAPREM